MTSATQDDLAQTTQAASAAPGVRSMTGFGGARAAVGGVSIDIEVRSVNGRQLKVTTRLPESLGLLASQLEEAVRERLQRGVVHVTVRMGERATSSGPRLDVAALERLMTELTAAAARLRVDPPTIGEVAALPGVVRDEPPLCEDPWPSVAAALSTALDALEVMRRREGDGVAQDLRRTAEGIIAAARQVAAAVPTVVREQGLRLKQRVEELLGEGGLDRGELAREVALLADKSDIAEELQRLGSHVEQLLATLDAPAGPIGRKLEFLAQELHREANTMASKTHDTALVQQILAIRLLVERIREQVANVE